MRTRSKVFCDTNLLIYAIDASDQRMAKARAIVKSIRDSGNGVVSTQVLQEFYSVCTRKLGLEPLKAKNLVMALLDFEVVTLTPDLIVEGIDISIVNQLPHWDGLLIAAARYASCSTLLSEDFSHGQVISGVRLENPLMAS